MDITMKKILLYISIIACGGMLASCNSLNELPQFDEKDAFVAFDNAAMSFDETAGNIEIPVTLASISGISTTVSYEATDGTAKSGSDYKVTGSGTLSFSASDRTAYIPITIISKKGEYTGDVKFTLSFKSTGDVNSGVEKKCVVTITDLDHPLTPILGSYAASADSYFSSRGHFDWTITFAKDSKDVSIVWIANIEPYFAKNGYVAPSYNYYYGNVTYDESMNPLSISIPVGQALGYDNGEGGVIALDGFSGPDPDESDLIESGGSLTFTIKNNGASIVIENAYGADNTAGENSWWNIMYGNQTITRK